MEINKRKPHELWGDYLTRKLKAEGYAVGELHFEGIDADGDISWLFLDKEIGTNKGKVTFNRMFDFNKDIFQANSKNLRELSVDNFNEYFQILEIDEGEENPYRDFGFIITNLNEAEIIDHSSGYQVPYFPGRNNWDDMPLIEKYRYLESVKPKQLVDDVFKYIQLVGVPFNDSKESRIVKPSYSDRLNLELKLK